MARLLSVLSVTTVLLLLLMLCARESRETALTQLPETYPASFVLGGRCSVASSSLLRRHAIEEINRGIHRRMIDIAPEISRNFVKSCSLGKCKENPVFSCNEMKEINGASPSGMYWVRLPNGSSIRLFCDFNRPCACSSGNNAWTQIAFHNMSNPNHSCPYNLRLNETHQTQGRRMCQTKHRGCSSIYFDSHGLSYSRVCGRVLGVQYGEPNAFRRYYKYRDLSLEDAFVDGVILTYGHSPRRHIWTFAAAEDETAYDDEACPCTRIDKKFKGVVPPFIGNDYFCDTGSRSQWREVYYTDDPLWDGQGCGSNSTCCTWQSPPWFCKQLSETTSHDIEMRVCINSSDEQILLELIEIYIQ